MDSKLDQIMRRHIEDILSDLSEDEKIELYDKLSSSVNLLTKGFNNPREKRTSL